MSCEGVRLDAYLDGELTPPERADLEAHLGECARCAAELRSIAAASAAIKAWRPERRGFQWLPLVAAAVLLLAAIWALLPGDRAPRTDGVVTLRAGESVRHAGARDYVAEDLPRPARIECAGGTLLASNTRFRLEDHPMRTRTKVAAGSAVLATAAIVYWGSLELSDRTGQRVTLREGRHEIAPPGSEDIPATPVPAPTEPEAPGDPFEAVTGVVLTPAGAPAPEASVALTYPVEFAGGAPDLTTVTDAEGRFRFASARRELILSASKPNVGAASGYFAPGAHVVLRLCAGAQVLGRLVDEEDGSAVAGALVSSKMTGGIWGHARAVSGEDGRFVLDGLDPDESMLWIRPQAHVDAVVRPRLTAGETSEVEIRLSRSPLQRGQVVDATTGSPVTLTAVEAATGGYRSARLLGDGRFEIHGKRPYTGVIVRAEGYPDTSVSFYDDVREQVFRIERGVLVRLRATDETGHPIAGVRVDLLRGTPGSLSATRWRDYVTGEDGETTVRLPTGGPLPWLAMAVHPGFVFEPAPFRINLNREGEMVVDLPARVAARLLGRVVVSDGRPAAGARIDVANRPCYALEDGRFRVDGLASGRVEVQARAADGIANAQADLHAGEETDMGDVVLRAAAAITGFVTRPDGSRIDRYKVWSWPEIGVVEPDGSFRIDGLEEGTARAVTVQCGNVTKVLPDVLAGTRNMEVRLDDYATIVGRVLVPDGERIPSGLSMGCQPAAGRSKQPIFELPLYMDGTFRIVVPAGRYELSASAEGSSYARASTEVEVRAGGTANVDLRLVPGGTVEGTVVSALPPDKVAIVTLQGEGAESPRSTRVTGDSFRLDGIPPGNYVVEARAFENGFRGTRQRVTVRARETTRCDLALVATGDLLVRAPAATKLALLDRAGNPVEASREERNLLLQAIWEAAGRPEMDKQGRDALSAEVDRALGAADAQGSWRRMSLFPGEYVVAAGDRRERITVRPGQTTDLDLR